MEVVEFQAGILQKRFKEMAYLNDGLKISFKEKKPNCKRLISMKTA